MTHSPLICPRHLYSAPLGIALVLALAGLGCMTTPDVIAPPVGGNLDHDSVGSEVRTAAKELEVAKRMVHAGNFSQVIPRLAHLASDYGHTPAGQQSHFFLGVSYHEIGGIQQAREHLQAYLEQSPSGEYAVLAQQYLAKLDSELDLATQSQRETEQRIETLEEVSEEQPQELAHKLELADLYWKKARFDEAGALYAQVLRQWPQLETDPTIRQRIERQTGGEFVILTPQEVERRIAEREPLLVVNTTAFKSGRLWGQAAVAMPRYYNVTGEVVNRSKTSLRNVRVIVTLYEFRKVIDTQTVSIGGMLPGERRAFSAKFANLPDMYDVYHYECVGTYER